MAGCHFGSASRSLSRASFAIARSTRRHAVGDPATRETHSDRSCSFTGMTGRTSSIATAPPAAARRSSYAARRHLWEHHLGGRPVPRCGRASPHLGHSPAGTCRIVLSVSLMPRQAEFRTDVWTGAGHTNRRKHEQSARQVRAADASTDSYGRIAGPIVHEVCRLVRRLSSGGAARAETQCEAGSASWGGSFLVRVAVGASERRLRRAGERPPRSQRWKGVTTLVALRVPTSRLAAAPG